MGKFHISFAHKAILKRHNWSLLRGPIHSENASLNPLPPNVPDLEHHICQWTTNASQEDLSNAGVLNAPGIHSINVGFPDKKMSFSPNVPELDIAISQQIVVRFAFRKKLLQWYAKDL